MKIQSQPKQDRAPPEESAALTLPFPSAHIALQRGPAISLLNKAGRILYPRWQSGLKPTLHSCSASNIYGHDPFTFLQEPDPCQCFPARSPHDTLCPTPPTAGIGPVFAKPPSPSEEPLPMVSPVVPYGFLTPFPSLDPLILCCHFKVCFSLHIYSALKTTGRRFQHQREGNFLMACAEASKSTDTNTGF